jgi:magnesium-protoporphyrin IX monomethyl ester (oxidative) cyclase
MRKSGCYELTIAFESGDQQVLDTLIKKPLNLQKAAGLVPVMKDLGIQVQAFFISGFPGETKKQVLQTFKFAEEMDLDGAWFFMANPTPGSDLYAMSLEKGYIAKDHSFDDINYNVPQFDTEHLSSCQIETMVLKQFNVFLMRCFLRHPFKFFRKYLSLFLTHPVKAFQTTMIDVVRLLKKDET